MKNYTTYLLALSWGLFVFFGCSKQTIEPNLTGSIKGQVKNTDTGQGIAGASISTNPGTSAILTDKNGGFEINDIPTGNYTVQAEKKDFKSTTVRLTVAENKATTADILLETKGKSGNDILDAEVTNFFNSAKSDSNFVDINYRVKNKSNQQVSKYQVTFKIYTPTNVFYSQISGGSLDIGQQSVGDTTKYIHKSPADSVVVSDIYTPGS